ncbi:MAG TPA: DUF4249 domain-containing protein [Chitinophagaceae bacterium]|nr:DUF4249 domain-containing protein [Chitinophagaceae bacterium]
MRIRKLFYFFTTLLLTAGCKEKFDPPIDPQQTNYLVADGYINAGQGSTDIYLSRTTQLKDAAQIKPELNATVSVMGDDNSVYMLVEKGMGLYSTPQLNIDKSKKYRLHIRTVTGKDYLSDFVPVKITPPIDSVNWRMENNGLQIFVNTHDPGNNTKYYKWDYEETWEQHSLDVARYKYIASNSSVVPRDTAEIRIMYYCWTTKYSSNILLGSTVALNNDIISLQPVIFIPDVSDKLGVRYSILVRQHALDQQAYEFYQLMKKNTESLGSVFDVQPSDITGNIHSLADPGEKVIGYIAASSAQEKRIFILRNDIGIWHFNLPCQTTEVKNSADSIKLFFGRDGLVPYQTNPPGGFGVILSYYSSSLYCLDCRVRGGSNVKPSFW